MTINNDSKSCLRCDKTISANKTACAACLTALLDNVQPTPILPRWDAQTSPLKISFWFGSPDAPDDVKEAVDHKYGDDCTAAIAEHCRSLSWRDAFATLIRTHDSWYEFHPKDLDWQVNGWLMQRNGVYPLSPLTGEEQTRQGNHWPHLPPNPTTADFAAEVMIQYDGDIERMSYDQIMARYMEAGRPYSLKLEAAAQKAHQTHYLALTAGLNAWTDPALASLPCDAWKDPAPASVRNSRKTKMMRTDHRLLLKRAYEVAYSGQSDINPLSEPTDLGDARLFEFALRNGLIPARDIKVDWKPDTPNES